MTCAGEKKFLSVALPVFNGANYLREALDSILVQDFEDFELVVSDNCSTDETPAILDEYRNRDSRIRVSRSEVFLAQPENCNRAVDLCAGEWVKLFCHDDLMRRDCLSVLSRVIRERTNDSVGLIGNDEAWLFANGYVYDPQFGRETDDWRVSGKEFVRRSLEGHKIASLPSVTTATVRKTAWNASSKFDRRFINFDVFLWTRMLMRWDCAFVSAALTINRIHGRQVAIAAREDLKSASDAHIFYTEFLSEFGDELKLSFRGGLRTRFRWAATAGSNIAVQVIKRNFASALRLGAKVPARGWPLLPLLVARSLYNERRKISALAGHVPISLIYPD